MATPNSDMNEEQKTRFNQAVQAYVVALDLAVKAHANLREAAGELDTAFSLCKMTEEQRVKVKSLLDSGLFVTA